MTKEEAIKLAHCILDIVDCYANLDAVSDYGAMIESIVETIGYEE